jgi:hypothetical protein
MNLSLVTARVFFCGMGTAAVFLGGVCALRFLDSAVSGLFGLLLIGCIFGCSASVWFHIGLRLPKGMSERNLRASWYLAVMLIGPGLWGAASLIPALANFPLTYHVGTGCIILALPAAEVGYRYWLREFALPPA